MMAGRAAECVATSDAAIALANELGEERFGRLEGSAVPRRRAHRARRPRRPRRPPGVDRVQPARRRRPSRRASATSTSPKRRGCRVGAQEGLELHEHDTGVRRVAWAAGPVMWSKAESTWMLFDLGRWDEILAITDELAALDEEAGSRPGADARAPLPRARARATGRPGRSQRRFVEDVLPKARAAADLQLLVPRPGGRPHWHRSARATTAARSTASAS